VVSRQRRQGIAFSAQPQGSFGIGRGTRASQIRIWVWDILEGESTAEIEASDSGPYTWIGGVLPIPIIRMTEEGACAMAAANIRQFVQQR
jgi:hypothetical protein